MMPLVRLLALLGLWLAASPVGAHEMSMAEMQVREIAPGDFLWQWSMTEKRPPAEVMTPRWPETCRVEPLVLHCGPQGLKGRLTMEGVGRGYSAALVRVTWLDGQEYVYTLSAGQPSVQLFGSADDRRGAGEIVSAYTLLGLEHILTGIDHLLFVIGLLFLVGFNRRLLWTITAFTAAHSLTLASAALGWLVLRSAPVEACIALSIVLVMREALGREMTLARRWPALVAFLFGLVHGLGFAGALKDIGLPEHHIPVALLTFNVGVELGQLLTVALAWGLWRVAMRWPALAELRSPVLYLVGGVAAYWSGLRVIAILG